MLFRNKKYKDSVFTDLFGSDRDGKKNFLDLYNALSGSDYKLEDVKLERKVIEQTLYKTYNNDVSWEIDGKLIATLTNEFGNAISTNVYVTLDGVTTKYTTDSNGQIRIKTENLSKGTHQATITYKGNNNYNPTTTIANITVK